MAFFGRNWLEDSERDEIGPFSHWDEDLENLDFLEEDEEDEDNLNNE